MKRSKRSDALGLFAVVGLLSFSSALGAPVPDVKGRHHISSSEIEELIGKPEKCGPLIAEEYNRLLADESHTPPWRGKIKARITDLDVLRGELQRFLDGGVREGFGKKDWKPVVGVIYKYGRLYYAQFDPNLPALFVVVDAKSGTVLVIALMPA